MKLTSLINPVHGAHGSSHPRLDRVVKRSNICLMKRLVVDCDTVRVIAIALPRAIGLLLVHDEMLGRGNNARRRHALDHTSSHDSSVVAVHAIRLACPATPCRTAQWLQCRSVGDVDTFPLEFGSQAFTLRLGAFRVPGHGHR